jgi:DNA-binding CsgD family transcriptional regulator
LTPREREALILLTEGLTSKEIAQRMNISAHTVKGFVHLIMLKLGVTTRSGIVGKINCS